MNKTVLISGVTSGIGKASAIKFLNHGYNVAGFGLNTEKVNALNKELSMSFNKDSFLIAKADIKKTANIKSFLKIFFKKFKNVDVLLNNAGYGCFSEPEHQYIDRFKDMLSVNLIGLAELTALVFPGMKKRKSGQIINISSTAGKKASFKGAYYSATKFGVMGYSEVLRNDMKEHGIKVAVVCPGMVTTGFWDKRGENFKKRMTEVWKGVEPTMLDAGEIANMIWTIASQPATSDIQEVTIVPFEPKK
jgi:NADP-dependent 3-hydroxy acid dehydrogenase YdfG